MADRLPEPRTGRTNTLAIISLISSFFVPIAGVITGHVALRQIRRSHEDGRALARGGLIIGYLLTALWSFMVVLLVIGIFTPRPAAPISAAMTPAATDPVSAAPTTSTEPGPPASAAEGRTWKATIVLDGKTLTADLFGAKAPKAVASFVSLAKNGYFDNSKCHRLTTSGIYVLQCGDPTGTGTGGPGYSFGPIENAPPSQTYTRGYLAMARQGDNGSSMGSQFFILDKDSVIPNDSAGGYTVFGQITGGIQAVDAIAVTGVAGGGSDGTPADPALISSIRVQ